MDLLLIDFDMFRHRLMSLIWIRSNIDLVEYVRIGF